MQDILGQDSNIFRRDSLYGRFQFNLRWFQVELNELYRFIKYFFKTTSPCQSKAQITVKKHVKNVKLFKKAVAIRSYSILTNVMLVSDRIRRTPSILLITCSTSLSLPSQKRQQPPHITEKPRSIRLSADSKSTTIDSKSRSMSTVDFVPR